MACCICWATIIINLSKQKLCLAGKKKLLIMNYKYQKADFLSSVSSAIRGIGYVFKTERNFRIQTLIGALVLILAIYLPLQTWERILMIIIIFAVLIMEIVNTALEKFNDLLKPRLHPYVYDLKNMMAGAVLLTSLLSVIIGLYILIPHVVNLVDK